MRSFSALIDRIYQGATNPGVWPEIIQDIAAWMEAPKILLFTPQNVPAEGGFMFPHGISQRFFELWPTHLKPLDVWVESAVEHNFIVQGNVGVGEELVPVAELIESRWYREVLAPEDIIHLVTSIVFDGSDGQNPCVVCSLYRGLGAEAFDDDDKQKLSLILPHISRALGVMLKLRNAEFKLVASYAALDRIGTGVLLVGGDRSILFANRAAKNLLADDDGLSLRKLGAGALGRLFSGDVKTQADIDTALSNAIEPMAQAVPHFAQSVRVRRPSGQLPYALQFSSLANNNEFGEDKDAPQAIIFISDPAQEIQVDPELLRKTYGLTPAEIRVAVTLCQEGSIEEVAAKAGVSVSTAKSQLRQVYQKTGVDNRTKLTKLIVSLAAVR
ncbi:MAG: helix-turn-helix transcriptional regulator [Gallionella sp.]|nr:helix-turn-helix transcriptional regulator [Gallionella sp.]